MRTTIDARSENRTAPRLHPRFRLAAVVLTTAWLAACSDGPTAPAALNAAQGRAAATASGSMARGADEPPDPCRSTCTTAATETGVSRACYQPPDPCKANCQALAVEPQGGFDIDMSSPKLHAQGDVDMSSPKLHAQSDIDMSSPKLH